MERLLRLLEEWSNPGRWDSLNALAEFREHQIDRFERLSVDADECRRVRVASPRHPLPAMRRTNADKRRAVETLLNDEVGGLVLRRFCSVTWTMGRCRFFNYFTDLHQTPCLGPS